MTNLYVPTKKDFKSFEENLLKKIDAKIDSKLKTSIKIYTSSDLEILLKVTPNTLRKYRQEGLTFIRISQGEYRYTYDDIVEFLSRNKYNHLKKLMKID